MNQVNKTVSVIVAVLILLATGLLIFEANHHDDSDTHGTHGGHGDDHAEEEVVKGPHNGRMLTSGGFSIELAIFETGVPPEFRVWASHDGTVLKPEDYNLNIKLTRLGGVVDDIKFRPFGDALRGDMEIYEPHSFVVTITATYKGKEYRWQYDNFEGRTKIEDAVAEALEIGTAVAGPVVLQETIHAYGKIVPNAEQTRDIRARFEGSIKSVHVTVGEKIKQGQALAVIESNQSLNRYTIRSPINGVITHRDANPGEQTDNRLLFTVNDLSTTWLELSVFTADRPRVKNGAEVKVKLPGSSEEVTGKIININAIAETNQSVIARVFLDNKDGKLVPGTFVDAAIKVAEHPVELAVKRAGLQAFRDFTVVYAKIGEEYEVRMLELGKKDDEWIEVLGGLKPGTQYVTDNSFVIKADIEKSGAAHDH